MPSISAGYPILLFNLCTLKSFLHRKAVVLCDVWTSCSHFSYPKEKENRVYVDVLYVRGTTYQYAGKPSESGTHCGEDTVSC